MSPTIRDCTAIVGVGYTSLSRESGKSTMTLAAEAVLAAVDDAGLTLSAVDGLATHGVNDSTPAGLLANVLGLQDLRFYLDQSGGGSVSHAVVAQAALAVATGVADFVVCYRALNGRSGKRLASIGAGSWFGAGPEAQYKAPAGLATAAQEFALAARAHMNLYGTTSEQLGAVSVSQRQHATMNERAMMREPITLEDYLSSRIIADPFHLLDCCVEIDGACAVVVTSADRARDLRHRPVLIRAAAWGGGATLYERPQRPLSTSAVADGLAPRLFALGGLGPADVDVAMLYDCFTFTVLAQLEDYGFCPRGESGPFVESGATALGGRLPVNTHGGFLSEGYVHGLNHVAEAVHQLRGDAGPRQVPGAEVALSSAQPGFQSGQSSALLLRAAS